MLRSTLSTVGPTSVPTQLSKSLVSFRGTTTAWLAMTTSLSADPRCSNHVYNHNAEQPSLIAFDPHLGGAADITCLPPAATEWLFQKAQSPRTTEETVKILGPMSCPDAYTTASMSLRNEQSTLVYCCPSEYRFVTVANHGAWHRCTSQQVSPLIVHYSSNGTTSSETREAGRSSDTAKVTAIALKGWAFNPSPSQNLSLPTSTEDTRSIMFREQEHGLMSFTGLIILLCGIVLGGILLTVGGFLVKKIRNRCRQHRREPEPTSNTTRTIRVRVTSRTTGEPLADNQELPIPPSSVELHDMEAGQVRFSSMPDTVDTEQTVVRHIEYASSNSDSGSKEEEMPLARGQAAVTEVETNNANTKAETNTNETSEAQRTA
jgi:hypothetical protein